MIGCPNILEAAALGSLAVGVGREDEALYSQRSWKVVKARTHQENLSASLDLISGWMFVGGPKGLRGWPLEKFTAETRFGEFKNPVSLVLADGDHQALYTVEEARLRRWTLKY